MLLFCGSAKPVASDVNSRMSEPSGSVTRTTPPLMWTRLLSARLFAGSPRGMS